MLKKKLIYLFPVLCAFLVVGVNKAQAQVVSGLKVKIPFEFHAGRTTLPAGNYTINVVGVESNLIEIRSDDDTHSAALVQTMDVNAESALKTAELVFDHTGEDYYLMKIFDQDGDSSGVEVIGAESVKK
jgi:hypothetical protein